MLKQCITYGNHSQNNPHSLSPNALSELMQLITTCWLGWLHALSPLAYPLPQSATVSSEEKKAADQMSFPTTKQLTEEYDHLKRSVTSSSSQPSLILPSTTSALLNKYYFYDLLTPLQGIGK